MKRGWLLAGASVLLLGIILTIVGAFDGSGRGKIHLTLIDKPTVMTAAYKVYGDSEAVGGKYWLAKLTLLNDGNGSLTDVRISYQIPDYIPWTTPQHYPEILPGQTIVSPFYPRLPDSVTKITSLTPSSIEVKIEYNDGGSDQTRIERRDFKFRGVQEIEYCSLPPSEILTWYDANDNSELNCAWVTEHDPVVRAYYAKISERSGGFGTMGNAKDLEQLARSTYNFMVATGMTYSGTEGVVEQRGDGWVLVQSMRLPRDVIYGNSGLCVELAQLWASIAMNAGARAYLVIIPGHCFPVLATSDFADESSLLPVEATGIGGAFQGGNLGGPMSFDDAVKVATKNFMKVKNGETPGIIIDIAQYRNEGIRPPELPAIDRTAFVKMLDDRIKEHQQALAARQGNAIVQDNAQNMNPQDGTTPMAGGQTWTDPNGRLSVAYPPNWFANPQAIANLRGAFPGYALSVVDPATHCGLDVIFFNGAPDAASVMQYVENTFRNMGFAVEQGQEKQASFAGVTGTVIPLKIQTPQGMLASVVSVVPVKGGMAMLSFGGPVDGFKASQQTLVNIVQSIRIAR